MLGRKEPCHCGSGRKYKNCCSRKDAEAAAMEEMTPTRYFGYDASMPASAGPLDLPAQGLVCMAFLVVAEDVADFRARSMNQFKMGDWAVSTGQHEDTVVHGPFASEQEAFDFGRTVGAIRFRSEPSFGGF